VRAPSLLAGALITIAISLGRVRRFPPARMLASAVAFMTMAIGYSTVHALTAFSIPFLNRWLYEIAGSGDSLLYGIAVIGRARYLVQERRLLQTRVAEATEAAEHDPLTGALNRRGLFSRARTFRSGTLYFLDAEGCTPAATVAALRDAASPGAVIARIDDDRFVVVKRERNARPEIIAERFAQVVSDASVGFVTLDGLPFENALRIAAANALRVKKRRRGA
jgi:GGDEF domain-containing protein